MVTLGFFAIHYFAWTEIQHELPASTKDSEKKFGFKTILSASKAGITAVSILVPGNILIIQNAILVESGADVTTIGVEKRHLLIGAILYLISLFFGVVTCYYIVYRRYSVDVSRDKATAMIFGFQLCALVGGMVQSLLGIAQLF